MRVSGLLTGESASIPGAVILLAQFDREPDTLVGTGFSLSDRFGAFAYLAASGTDDPRFEVNLKVPGGCRIVRLGFRLFRSEHALTIGMVTVSSSAPGATQQDSAPLAIRHAAATIRVDRVDAGAAGAQLPVPEVIGNRIDVVAQSAAEVGEAVLIVELDSNPSSAILERNGLLRRSNGQLMALGMWDSEGHWSASFSLPDGSSLRNLRVAALAERGAVTLQDVAVRRGIVSPGGKRVLVNISFDVEALPGRAKSDHVARLMYGHFGGEDFGVPRLLKVCHELGVPATFYLECGQCALWGYEPVAGVARTIQAAGFDLQLHLHSELVARAHGWHWTKPVPPMLHNLSAAETFRVLGYAAEQFHAMAGTLPTAFRAGGYQFGPHTLDALQQLGILSSSNYRADQRPKNAFDFEGAAPMLPFLWDNGVFEFPVTISPEPLTALAPEEVWRRILHHVQVNGTWVVNVVLHSWSFLHRDAEGLQIWRGPDLENIFRRFIQMAPEGVEFASIRDIVHESSCEAAPILEKRIADLFRRLDVP